MEDEKIVELFWERSERAIFEASAKYGGYCHSIAGRILEDPADAEESVNDTYLAAWNSIPPHRPAVLSAYLGKLTRRISLDRWRKNHAAKRGGGQIPVALEELETCLPAGNDPAAAVEEADLTRMLDRFLSELSEHGRIIFLQRYWYLLSVEEIARNLHFSESKVKTSLMRSRRRLRSMLEEEGIPV